MVFRVLHCFAFQPHSALTASREQKKTMMIPRGLLTWIALYISYGLINSLDQAVAFSSLAFTPISSSTKFDASLSPCTKWRESKSQRYVLQKEKSTVEEPASSSITSDKAVEVASVEIAKKEGSDGLPWWWEYVWELDMMKRGEPGTDIILGDSAHVLRTNIEQIYGGYPSLDGCPMATGEITDIAEGTMFIGLMRYNQRYGSPFKLCFGPKSFLTVSDPVQMKHILRDANTKYDKGILAEILKPIMGKGLIPADPETWYVTCE